MTEPIKMIEIFSGIGAQAKALNQLLIPHEVVATLDIEKDAILSYASIRYDIEKEMATYNFPSKEQMISELQNKNVGFDFQKNKHSITMKTNENKVKQYYISDKLSKNLGDVSLVKKLPYADIIVHSSPCQAFSQAGKGEGGDEGSGTTSSLMWESLRLIETSKPKYVLWENVSAVLSGKHRHNFLKYLERMSELGYENAFDLLNGKNYGVPQNRLRIFCVSRKIESNDNKIRNIDDMQKSSNKQVESTIKEIKNNPNIRMWVDYKFPETIPLTTRLKDMLEKNVDEKFYLPDERIEKIINSTFMQEKKRIQMTDICDTLLARDWKDPKCVPVEEPEVRQIMNVCPTKTRDNPNQGRVYDVNGIAPTLTKMDGGNREPMVIEQEPFIVASRGRNPENPSDRTTGAPTEQRLEPNFSGCTNTLTSVAKDNYVAEPIVCEERKDEGIRLFKDDCVGTLRTIDACGDKRVLEPAEIRWRIRKLVPVECWKLMAFTREDHDRAASYVSNSALYKQAGNSIIVNVLVALMSSLFIEDGHKAEVWTKYALNPNE